MMKKSRENGKRILRASDNIDDDYDEMVMR